MNPEHGGTVPESPLPIPRWKRTYTCENLTYTMPSLLAAMGLILLGFFTYTLSMAFVPQIMPLKLEVLGANNKEIAFIMLTIGQVFNITVCPMVSFQSDRFRSRRWGRRIPFILFTMPMMCAAWLLFAFVDSEAAWLSPAIARFVTVAPATLAVILIGLIMLLYQFFLMYVGSVIYYIYNDTIPAQFLARFVGMIQVVTTLAGTLFAFFIFPYGVEFFRPILIGTVLIYGLGVGAMCLLLREPRFPEPGAAEVRQSPRTAGIVTFFRESFSHKFYWYSFFGVGASAVASCIGTFTVFFYRDMGLQMGDIGRLNGVAGLAGMIISMLVASAGAVLIDRWHPVRVFVIGMLFSVLLPLLYCQWLFFTPPPRIFWMVFVATNICFSFAINFRAIANMPMLMRIYPKSRFGQFCSAQSMLRSGMVLTASLVLGAVIDILKYNYHLGDFAYRFLWVWNLFWTIVASIFFVLMYRQYFKLGGFAAYQAPATWSETGFEPMPATPVHGPSRKLLNIALPLLDAVLILPLAGAGFMIWYCRRGGMPATAEVFAHLALPAAVGVLVFWGLVRMGIRRDIRRVRRGEPPKNGLPHHGLLMIFAATHLLLFACTVYQSWMTAVPEDGTGSGWMWFYQMMVNAVLVALLYLYLRIERGFSTTLTERHG